jgi:hypothetical protein
MSDTSEKGNLLTNVFTKSRRDKKGGSEADSINSISPSTATDGSLDSLVGKTKEAAAPGVLKKLVPGSKWRRRREDEEAQRLADEEADRGRRVADRGILQDHEHDHTPPSLPTEDSGDRSSQLTEESEDDAT